MFGIRGSFLFFLFVPEELLSVGGKLSAAVFHGKMTAVSRRIARRVHIELGVNTENLSGRA